MKFNAKQLRHRILQPTAELMAEVGATGDGYAIRQTGAPVLAVAHCDYRDCGSDHFLAHKGKVWSSRLDDRLGVYVILDVLPKLGIHVDVLLSDDEESGKSTAQFYQPESHGYNWLVQFDRHGTDAVCYDYTAMESYLKGYFKVGCGSFSDISMLEHLGICGVNVGTAYYEEHTLGSYAIMSELRLQLERFTRFYADHADLRIAHDLPEWQQSWDDVEWHRHSSGYYADEFEIRYLPADDGYDWKLSTLEGNEWFRSLGDAKARAEELFYGV